MEPKFFKDQQAFRRWLEKNHDAKKEIVVGYYKVSSGRPSMTWSESVDQALCFGWIDGVRRSIDDESYQIRFTPRKSSSIWSTVNINKVKELTRLGLMEPAGIDSFSKRKEARSSVYAFENQESELPESFLKKFKAEKKAWKYFESLAPSYRKTSKHWVMSAKQEATREKRLAQLIADCIEGTNRWKDSIYNKKK